MIPRPEPPTLLHPAGVHVRLATSPAEVREAQRLRYEVFHLGMGLGPADAEGLDRDAWDEPCEHLLALEQGRVVGTYRLLPPDTRTSAGLYAAGEFRLDGLLELDLRLLELGRSCVHPDARTGGIILQLLRGIADRRRAHAADALIGCVSIPGRDPELLRRAWALLAARHRHPLFPLVEPRAPLACLEAPLPEPDARVLNDLPPLFKAYLRMGAQVCGLPTWDGEFGTTDVFLLLSSVHLEAAARRLGRAA